MCSRCSSSSGASRHMISIASWSPRKSDPLTVSYACDSQVSSGFSAALIPLAAATECERTGWTLLMIATVAPSSAAARAARWPARPAPMMRTSWEGMSRNPITWASRAVPRGLADADHRLAASSVGARAPPWHPPCVLARRRRRRARPRATARETHDENPGLMSRRRRYGPPHLLDRHDAAEEVLPIEREDRAEA